MSEMVERARDASAAIYLVVDEAQAKDISEVFISLAEYAEALEARVKELESLARWSTRRFRQNNLDIYADYIEGFTSDE